MAQQVIKLKLIAFDHRNLDKSIEDIVHAVKRTGAEVKGPIPLPTKIERFIVNRSSHIDKESREQFEIRTHKRVVFIELSETSSPHTMDALMKLDLPAGVEVEEIKLNAGNE